MPIRFARGTEHFVPPKQWESMRRAKELEKKLGQRIVHFEKGDFAGEDFTLPEHISEAAIKVLRQGGVRYDPGPGIPPLREAIAREMTGRGRPTEMDEVVVTGGAKHALFMSLLTLLDPGDEVIFPNPGYPPDEVWIRFCGAKPVYAPLNPPTFQYDLDRLEEVITPRTKLLILNTPQRPNGCVVKDLEKIAEICLKHDLLVISDEIFSHIVYEGRHRTISEIPEMRDRTIVIDTFSKTYTMTGFRIGWIVAPRPIAEKLSIFLQDSITNVALFIQEAALAALTGPQEAFEKMRQSLKRKRDRFVTGLNKIPGIQCLPPEGTFYAFPNISGTGMTSQQFTDYLMNSYGVAVVSGTAFGSQGEGFVRMTFAVPDEEIEEGLKRIRQAVENLFECKAPKVKEA